MKLRRDLTELMLNDFGFSIEKQEKKIEKFRQIHQSASNIDEQVERTRAFRTQENALNGIYITIGLNTEQMTGIWRCLIFQSFTTIFSMTK